MGSNFFKYHLISDLPRFNEITIANTEFIMNDFCCNCNKISIRDVMLEQAVEVNKFLTKDLTDDEREFLIATLKKIRNSK